MSVAGIALLFMTTTVKSIAADPERKYNWEHYTVDAGETLSFHVRYNGGEYGDAKAIPDRDAEHDYDDIEMKVVGDYGWTKILEAKDTTHIDPQCQWWVGAMYGDGLDYIIKITNNESHSVGFNIKFY
jgi:hypothetical protein